jgi:3-phenylpropionate/cinnamic acid dioxygenase small subunit
MPSKIVTRNVTRTAGHGKAGAARKNGARKRSAAGKATPRRPAPPAASASAKPGTRLSQEIVIESASDAQIGAEAIAPDHSPRSTPSGAAAVASIARPVPAPATDVLREIEQFLYRQSELLDNKLWQDYIDLFADDGVYWMPVTPEQTEWEGSPSIFAEDRFMMEVRMGRVTHPTAWSQVPMWGTSHVIGNVVLESESHDEWVVRSRFHMMELRRDAVRHFAGTYRHTLVRRDGQLRIKLQRVDMVNAQAPYDYVLQVWV